MIIAGHLLVDRSERDAFVEAHRDLVTRARNLDGCLHFAITADGVDPARVNVVEIWESAEALDSWREVSNPPELESAAADVQMKRYDAEDGGPLF